MKNRKLIALDLDGTLLDSKKNISDMTCSYLKELEDEGHIICLTSGRSPRSIYTHYSRIGLKRSPYIGYNGDYVYDINDKSVTTFDSIPVSFIREFLEVFKFENFSYFVAEDLENLYVNDPQIIVNEFDFLNPNSINVNVGKMPDIFKRDELYEVFFECEHDDNVREQIRDFTAKYDHVDMRFWYDEPYFGEFFVKHISKANGLKHVQEKYDIKDEDIIAIGDGNNDFEMLDLACIGYAMKNGAEKLKENRKYITKYTNDEEGVYHTLKDILAK